MNRCFLLLLVLVNVGLAGMVNSADAGETVHKIYAPRPPYPLKAYWDRDEGICTLRIVTDKTGKVVRATVVKSSGHLSLDRNSVGFVLEKWYGPPNDISIKQLEYRLKRD